MASSPPSPLRLIFFGVGGGLLVFLAVLVAKHGTRSLPRAPAWIVSAAKRKLSLEPDASAGGFYDRTGAGPLSLAAIVNELHTAWPTETPALVHGAALEVGTGLLHRSDIEVGEMVGGKFVPSPAAPWQTNEQMRSDLKEAPGFFANDHRYVFRRK